MRRKEDRTTEKGSLALMRQLRTSRRNLIPSIRLQAATISTVVVHWFRSEAKKKKKTHDLSQILTRMGIIYVPLHPDSRAAGAPLSFSTGISVY